MIFVLRDTQLFTAHIVEVHIVGMLMKVWNTVMNAMEWSKKEELVADQALKHLQQYSSLLAAVTSSGRSQLILINKVQDYCYDNMNFLKVFSKMIQLFYRSKTRQISLSAVVHISSERNFMVAAM